MEPKPEASNGTPAPKPEPSTPQGQGPPKQKFQPGAPNLNKKKNLQNRVGKMGNNQQGNFNRGPMKNEVSKKDQFFHSVQVQPPF